MSAHRLPADMALADWVIDTPATGAPVGISKVSEHKLVIGTTAETNTVADPQRAGLMKLFTVVSVGSGGSRAITFATAVDQNGTTVLTFNTARQTALLWSVPDGLTTTGYRWQILVADATNAGNALVARVSTQYDIATSTVLANVPGLSVNVQAGKTYRFRATLYLTVGTTGGAKVAVGGTATATAIGGGITYIDFATPAVTGAAITALGTGVTKAGVAAYQVEVVGTITVNAAGTLTIQFAQAVSNGTNSSVLVGSTFDVALIP